MRVIDLSTLSLVGGSGIAESKIPLWWADGTSLSVSATGTSGTYWLRDGNSISSTAPNQDTHLFTLSSTFSTSTQFALEATGYCPSASYTSSWALWDFSLGTPAVVSGSTVSTSATTFTVVRSGKFTLVPGHIYGVTLWGNGDGGYVCDASLIIFP